MAGHWCVDCRRIWPAKVATQGNCPACGGTLRADRRSADDRRGPLQRNWDPEPRSWSDRRQAIPPPPAA
jgi:hypothetical protein